MVPRHMHGRCMVFVAALPCQEDQMHAMMRGGISNSAEKGTNLVINFVVSRELEVM